MWQSTEHRNHTKLNFEQSQNEFKSLIEDWSYVRLQEHKIQADLALIVILPATVLLHPPAHLLPLPPLSEEGIR